MKGWRAEGKPREKQKMQPKKLRQYKKKMNMLRNKLDKPERAFFVSGFLVAT